MGVQASLDKLADLLHLQLVYKGGAITGSAELAFSPIAGMAILLEVKVVKTFLHDAVGLIAHVGGNLYLVASHATTTGGVTVFLVDQLQLPGGEFAKEPFLHITKQMSLREVIDAVRGGIVASFLWQDRAWKELKLPV